VDDSKSCRVETPFILNFLEVREGAMSATTSGTPNDIDCADMT